MNDFNLKVMSYSKGHIDAIAMDDDGSRLLRLTSFYWNNVNGNKGGLGIF